MNRTKKILEELKALNLSLYPYESAKTLIEELIGFYGILHVIPKGSSVIRARPNVQSSSFREPRELSYKPQEYNNTFQRASTPHKTVFYAGALSNTNSVLDKQAIVTLEASPLIRGKLFNEDQLLSDEIQIETITYGKWEVIKDLPLIALCYYDKFVDKHPLTKSLHDSYIQSLSKLTKEEQDNSNLINQFFAAEFAKDRTEHDYEYLLSALFTEAVLDIGYAGVLYPSVRCEGEGFNIAIAPEFVPAHLRLTTVGEAKIYNRNKEFVINNETFSLVKPGQKRFTFNSLKGSRFHKYTSESEIIEYLNSK